MTSRLGDRPRCPPATGSGFRSRLSILTQNRVLAVRAAAGRAIVPGTTSMEGVPMTDDSLPNVGQVSTEIIDGLRVRLARSGRADGLPVLFTSPWPESLYAFHRVLPYFTDSHLVIAIDLPGYGASESRPEVMSPSAMGAFLVKLAAHLNIRKLHGVGPDVGALAFLFAAAPRRWTSQ